MPLYKTFSQAQTQMVIQKFEQKIKPIHIMLLPSGLLHEQRLAIDPTHFKPLLNLPLSLLFRYDRNTEGLYQISNQNI